MTTSSRMSKWWRRRRLRGVGGLVSVMAHQRLHGGPGLLLGPVTCWALRRSRGQDAVKGSQCGDPPLSPALLLRALPRPAQV